VRLDTAADDIILEREELSLRQLNRPPLQILKRDKQGFSLSDESGQGLPRFELKRNLSGLANLPMDESKFPTAVWLKELLGEGVQTVMLDNALLRAPGSPAKRKPRRYDGCNLAKIATSSENLGAWVEHVRTALPDIAGIQWILRPEDKGRYIMVMYRTGIEVPSWMLSDGTLRLLALTLMAYLPGANGTYLVEEPEVGVHPTAIETIMQSLSSIYDGQVLVTSHSPIVLGLSKPDEILCFQMTDSGTKIVRGDEHPLLQEWRSNANLSDFFAAGVLG
jgi:hypothetical protein